MYEFKNRSLRNCAALTGFASSLLFTGIAQAQLPPEGENIESIVITGSRIARDGYNAPTPVSVLSTEDIDAEAPASIAEFAMTLP